MRIERNYNRKAIITIITLIFSLVITAFPVMALEDGEACTHEWSDWNTVQEADCGYTGSQERYCYICGEFQTADIPATNDHSWSSWEVIKKATIKAAGQKTRECYYCGTIQTATIAKVTPFAKFTAKTFSVAKGKTISMKSKLKFGNGDAVKKWKVSNSKVATISKTGKLKAKKTGKVKVTVVLKSGKKATCTVKVTKKAKATASALGGKVYWTPSGSVYHRSRSCPTLARSSTVKSGTVAKSGKKRACKVCG